MTQPVQQVPAFVDAHEAAKIARKTPDWIRAKVRRGDLPAYRVGQDLIIDGGDLVAFLKRIRSHVDGKAVTTTGELQNVVGLNRGSTQGVSR